MRKNVLLAMSLSLNLLFLSGAGFIIYRKGGLRYLRQYRSVLSGRDLTIESFSPYYQSRFSDFLGQDRLDGAVIFVGDSLTEQGDWPRLLGRRDILNRGIGADTTVGLKFRLGELLKHKPKKVFLMIGIADLRLGRKPQAVLGKYEEILRELRAGLPEGEIYVQSVLPINTSIFGREIQLSDIHEVNRGIESLASAHGAKFIDLHPQFAVENGELDPALTVGGVHLNAAGYAKWARLLLPYL